MEMLILIKLEIVALELKKKLKILKSMQNSDMSFLI